MTECQYLNRGQIGVYYPLMTKLTKDDVLKLARLARLRLSQEEVEQFSKEFTEILAYVEQLKDTDTEGLKPTYQVNGLATVTRSDEDINYGTAQKDLLSNVPRTKDGHIQVKRMIG